MPKHGPKLLEYEFPVILPTILYAFLYINIYLYLNF